jgi:ribonucleotide reductase alpha subunit
VKNDEDVTLYCPHESGLYKYWGTSEFTDKYEAAASKHLKIKKTIKARELLFAIARERLETGRIYIMNMDHANKCAWNQPIRQSNLCCLSGESIVNVIVNGNLMKVNIQELHEIFDNDKTVKISSYSEDHLVFDKVLAVIKTKTTSDLLKITDTDSGKSLICTPDHKIYTENRGFVEAQNLLEADILKIV